MTRRTSWRPAAGRRVRKADGSLLAEAGERIAIDPYFARLIADGDIVPVSVPTRSKKA